jgi:RNA recognition motif-containing protein
MKLYVGNISPETPAQHLRDSFEKFGDVTKVKIVSDKTDGDSKCFGFVQMASKEHATAAIAGLDGTNLSGNRLHVMQARKSELTERGVALAPDITA